MLHQNTLYSHRKRFPDMPICQPVYRPDIRCRHSVEIIPCIAAPLRSFQQEESQSYNTEKHQEVHAEEHPTTAIQPLRHRVLCPHWSVPEESSRSVLVHSIENKTKEPLTDLLVHRKLLVNIPGLFIFVAFFLGQCRFAFVSLSQRMWRRAEIKMRTNTMLMFSSVVSKVTESGKTRTRSSSLFLMFEDGLRPGAEQISVFRSRFALFPQKTAVRGWNRYYT